MKEIKGRVFYFHASIVFALLGCDFLVLFIDRIVDGRSISQLTSINNWYAKALHSSLVIIIWCSGLLIYYFWMKRKEVMADIIRFKVGTRQFVCILLSLVFVIIYTIIEYEIYDMVPLQISREYLAFVHRFGDTALLIAILQNIYYLMETGLVILIIVFMQRAGELWFNNKKIPWGGIGLSLSWGLIHLLSQPIGGVLIVTWSLLLGAMFVISNKNFQVLFILAFLAFII